MTARARALRWRATLAGLVTCVACGQWEAPIEEAQRNQTSAALQILNKNGAPNAWSSPVPVCLADTAWDTWPSKFRDAVADALNTTWGLLSGLDFTGFGHCSGSETHTLIFDHWDDNGGQSEPYGPNPVSPYNTTVHMNYTPPDEHGNNETDLRGFWNTVVHESGHALGFPHEQDADFNFNSSGTPIYCEPGIQRDGTQLIDYYDRFSIMNYCGHEFRTWDGNAYAYVDPQGLSLGDIQSAQALYGPSSRSKWVFASGSIFSLLF